MRNNRREIKKPGVRKTRPARKTFERSSSTSKVVKVFILLFIFTLIFFFALFATAREFDVAAKASCVFFGGGAIGAMIKAMCDQWEDLDRQVNERI